MLVVAVDADGGMESTKAAMESQLQELRGNCLDSSWVGYSDCPALIERHERFMGEFESNFSSLQSLLWGRVLDGELIVTWLNLFLIPVD